MFVFGVEFYNFAVKNLKSVLGFRISKCDLGILGLRIQKCKIGRVKDLKKQKFPKMKNLKGKLKMSLGQIAFPDVSGNSTKLDFSKILPADL